MQYYQLWSHVHSHVHCSRTLAQVSLLEKFKEGLKCMTCTDLLIFIWKWFLIIYLSICLALFINKFILSSAKSINVPRSEQLTISFIYIRKSKWPEHSIPLQIFEIFRFHLKFWMLPIKRILLLSLKIFFNILGSQFYLISASFRGQTSTSDWQTNN